MQWLEGLDDEECLERSRVVAVGATATGERALQPVAEEEVGGVVEKEAAAVVAATAAVAVMEDKVATVAVMAMRLYHLRGRPVRGRKPGRPPEWQTKRRRQQERRQRRQ